MVEGGRDDPFARATATFGEMIERRGYSAEALDYSGREAQAARFSVLEAATDYDGKCILDVGCGFADFADFLEARGNHVSYTGIDITEEAIQIARDRRPDLDLRVANVLDLPAMPTFEIVVANGIFYLIDQDAEQLMQQVVSRMVALSTEVVAFTSLSTWADSQQSGEWHADPARTLDFCRSLSPRVVLRHDYHPADFAVYLYRMARP
jgi:SAM-dependent methyltransferase